MIENKLTHLTEDGLPRMVDISDKQDTYRLAKASCDVLVNDDTFEVLKMGNSKKGDIISVAKIAGILAAKKTSDIIPLCHNILMESVDISIDINEKIRGLTITSVVKTFSKTGAEMEALTAVSVAALTVYDMLKAIEKTIRITNIRLLEKHGGKSGLVVNK